MRVYGLDFTSDPSDAKPITKAVCTLKKGVLNVESLGVCTSWQAFSVFLAERGEWICGIDFPFGQPTRLINDLQWPTVWEQYVTYVATHSKSKYTQMIDEYRAGQDDGDKEHYRDIDRRAGSLSPMKMYGIPVGKMFQQGAPFLLTSSCQIVPFRMNAQCRTTVIEAYPGLVARKFIQRRSYKNDSPAKQTDDQRAARSDIKNAICLSDGTMRKHYGFFVSMPEAIAKQCSDDPTGDKLDSILCAIQAAWAHLNRERNFGVPPNLPAHCINIEGWIPDPETAKSETK